MPGQMNADPWGALSIEADAGNLSTRAGDMMLLASGDRSMQRRKSLQAGKLGMAKSAASTSPAVPTVPQLQRPSDILRAAQAAGTANTGHTMPEFQGGCAVKKRARAVKRSEHGARLPHPGNVPRRVRYVRGIPGHAQSFRAGVSQAALSVFTESGQSVVQLQAPKPDASRNADDEEPTVSFQLQQVHSRTADQIAQERVSQSFWARQLADRRALEPQRATAAPPPWPRRAAASIQHMPGASDVVHAAQPRWSRRMAEAAEDQRDLLEGTTAALTAALDVELAEAAKHMAEVEDLTDDGDGGPLAIAVGGSRGPGSHRKAAAHRSDAARSSDDALHSCDDSSVEIIEDDDGDDIEAPPHTARRLRGARDVRERLGAARRRVAQQPAARAGASAGARDWGSLPAPAGGQRARAGAACPLPRDATWRSQAALLLSAETAARPVMLADVEQRRVHNQTVDMASAGSRKAAGGALSLADAVVARLRPRAAAALVGRAVAAGATGRAVLLLGADARLEQAETRYRRLARLLHPDRTLPLAGDCSVDDAQARAAFNSIRAAIEALRATC